MVVERLYARINTGCDLKVHVSLASLMQALVRSASDGEGARPCLVKMAD